MHTYKLSNIIFEFVPVFLTNYNYYRRFLLLNSYRGGGVWKSKFKKNPNFKNWILILIYSCVRETFDPLLFFKWSKQIAFSAALSFMQWLILPNKSVAGHFYKKYIKMWLYLDCMHISSVVSCIILALCIYCLLHREQGKSYFFKGRWIMCNKMLNY